MATTSTEYRFSQLDLPSDILRMARTLGPLPPQDLEMLKSTLSDYQGRLRTIQSLLGLESQGASMMAQGLKRLEPIARYRVQACQNILATWRSLPVELWDKIFALYVEETRSPRAAPHTLMMVCRVWKAAVLSSPAVWRPLSIQVYTAKTSLGDIPLIPYTEIDALVSRLKHHATKGFPWTLTLAFHPGDISPALIAQRHQASHGLPAATVVQAHAAFSFVDRLTMLLMATDQSYPEFGNISLPSVSSLVIGLLSNAGAHSLWTLPRLVGLKKAVLISVEWNIPFLTNIPWSNLTHLVFASNLQPAQAQELLTRCPSLMKAHMIVRRNASGDGSTTASGGNPSGTHTVMRHLERLGIQYLDLTPERLERASEPINVFNAFAFPALTDYHVAVPRYAQNPFRGSCLSAFGTLTHFTFIAHPVRRDDDSIPSCLSTILDECPMLVELVASAFNSSVGHILQPLTFDPSKPRGQCLKTLVILWDAASFASYDYSLTESKFLDLVSSRRTGANDDVGTATCATLSRLIVRLCEIDGVSARTRAALIDDMARIRVSLLTFVESGLQSSFEVTNKSLKWYLQATGQHWDDSQRIIAGSWEYTGSMPPPKGSYL